MSGHFLMLKDFLKDLKCASLLARVFDNYKTLLQENVYAAVKRREDRFNVLCHGDLWSNNIMFRYSEGDGSVQECLFVDFQMGFFSSPMLDLHYFMVNSLGRKNKIEKMDLIIHLYHQNLVRSLRYLGYKKRIPSLLDLQMDFVNTGAFGLFSLITCNPVITAPASDDLTIENLANKSQESTVIDIKRKIYANKIFVKNLEELIPYYDMKGYLEV